MLTFSKNSKMCVVISMLMSAFLVTSTQACKSRYDLNTYSKSKAAGKISEGDWSYGYAYTDPDAKLPAGQEVMLVLLVEKPKHACPDASDLVGDKRNVSISFDGKIGDMIIGGTTDALETEDTLFSAEKSTRHATVAFQNPSFAEGKQYLFASRGKLKITKITPKIIQGAFVAKFDENNFANGQFKAKICVHGQLN
jgi:hypothetical protein